MLLLGACGKHDAPPEPAAPAAPVRRSVTYLLTDSISHYFFQKVPPNQDSHTTYFRFPVNRLVWLYPDTGDKPKHITFGDDAFSRSSSQHDSFNKLLPKYIDGSKRARMSLEGDSLWIEYWDYGHFYNKWTTLRGVKFP